jgi:cytoskeleton protein RodZ
MNAKKPPETESFDAAELGAMMREMREKLGHELDAVARDLRIRLVYLEAIESGRLSDLPGNAYVSGFLRSYSDFLGLEGEEIVRRFKMAGAEISNQPQLHLPSPVEEGRLPTASILLVAAVIAAAAYGGWYYMSGSGKGPMETVANLPKELSTLVDDAKNQTEPTSIANTPEAPEAKPDTGTTAVQSSDPVVPETSNTDAAPAAETSPSAQQDEPAGTRSEQIASAAVTVTPADTVPAIAPATAAEPAPAAAPASATVEVPSSDDPVRTAAVTPAPRPDPAPVVSTSSSPSDSSTVSSAGGVRIVVRATVDSYVAVRTRDNETLFSQLMRPGDSYEVPSGADLTLETGNAGGLRISVGGKRVPSLGPIGEIRRNIPLDAEKLLSGIN